MAPEGPSTPGWEPPTEPTPAGPPTGEQPPPPSGPPPSAPPPSGPGQPQPGYGPPPQGGWGQPPPPGASYVPPGGQPPRKGPNPAVIAVIVVVALLAAGIGAFAVLGGGDDDDGGGDGGTPTSEASASGAITDVQEAEGAVVQINSQGSFVDPEEGLQVLNAAGAGSGFIIDPSGIAVTNNHVVTGAATLEVVLGGDTDDPRNARVLGTSECSDLAVIDIEGEGFPFLELYDGEINAGLDVFAAGFPLGDPEFSLTRGIVSKAEADGETNWASVDSVIEHDATINPGNSGGPLLTDDAQVIGVNYAGDSEANQYFAIAPPTATEVVEELRDGEFVDYLGINGQAVVYDDDSSGVFVAAVESGSPAAELGLEGGDIIEKLEGLSLATDGTMADYCDVLRTKGDDAEISAQVLRIATEERLQGTFNSGEELELSESLGDELTGSATAQGGAATYADYQNVTDDSGSIEVEVPTEWSGVDGSAYALDDGSQRPRVLASPDLEGFRDNFSTSGVFVISLPGGTSSDPATLLTELLGNLGATDACPASTGQEDYDDGLYTGVYELLNGCDGGDASFAGIVASPEGGEFTVFVGVQLVVEADFEALDRIIQSFKVTS